MASSTVTPANSQNLSNLVWVGMILYGIYWCANNAYTLRLHSIKEFGTVIHEFDPYFNWRATQYLDQNGWKKFATWFDYKVWYPLGRPVGTTIYPGMQVTAVFLKQYIFRARMTLNDICCYMPAWFGVAASTCTGLIAYECSIPESSSGSLFTVIMDIYNGEMRKTPKGGSHIQAAVIGVIAMGIMSMIPAHMMRSVGGGYDNESIAVTAMTLTFWMWCRSLRNDQSWVFGIATGVAYFYMVAAWGGYVFVLNLIGVHAGILVLLGRFSTKIYRAYSLFYVIGTALAIQVPVVGFTPLKSLEQLGPCAVFLGYQVLQYCEIVRKRKKLSRSEAYLLRAKVGIVAGALACAVIFFMTPKGYFGPFSARIRGLFVKHTKTGNPLVDSVAEHQPANANAYHQYLQIVIYSAPAGFAMVLFNLGDSSSFLLVYGFVSYFFSSKMVRLVLLLGPIASILTGVVVGIFATKGIELIVPWLSTNGEADGENSQLSKSEKNKKDGKKDSKKKKSKKVDEFESVNESAFIKLKVAVDDLMKSNEIKMLKQVLAVMLFATLYFSGKYFYGYCEKMSHALSNPSIILKGKLQSGKTVIVDDYRESYFWLRDNTPDDARILSWWDYGYQITGIANRTTLADGNTWNHEHIALLGKILTTTEEEGYEIARHLADYVLIWAGGGGDDLAKSPHLARIANSVYRDLCPGDVACRAFGVRDKQGTPSAMMERSFLFKLHGHKLKPGVEADPNKFKEVFRSKYGKVRIFKILAVSQESKNWVVKNRKCDVPGSWYCPGSYPPALKDVLDTRKDFAQLEDFNSGNTDSEYQKAYFDGINKAKNHRSHDVPSSNPKGKIAENSDSKFESLTSDELEKLLKDLRAKLSPAEIDDANKNWDDTEETTMMWNLISEKSIAKITKWLSVDPIVGFMRSSDGRGPMWWAYENRYMEVAVILTKLGVSNTLKDKYGKTPIDLLTSGSKKL